MENAKPQSLGIQRIARNSLSVPYGQGSGGVESENGIQQVSRDYYVCVIGSHGC